MSQSRGLVAALVGSALGGSAVAATRFAVASIEPLSVVTLRYAIGALCLAPFCLPALRRLQGRADAAAVAGLGIWFFALYPMLFTLALAYTTAARGALALTVMPLGTLALSVLLGREAFSWRRLAGIGLASAGLAYAFLPGWEDAPPGAWQGDLVMVAAAFMQALYNVLSAPFIQRIGALSFTALALCVGAGSLVAASVGFGALAALPRIDGAVWAALVYMGIFGCGLLWLLWSLGLRQASASLVALTSAINPVTASLLASFYLSEPVGHELAVGLVAVLAGIGVAMKRA